MPDPAAFLLRHADALYGTLDFGRHWVRILAGAKYIAAIYFLGPLNLWCAGDSPGLIYNDLILILNANSSVFHQKQDPSAAKEH